MTTQSAQLPINEAAVALLRERGMPMTTVNLNRAMNMIGQQRFGMQDGVDSAPDKFDSAVEKSMQPAIGKNTASTSPQNPVANTRSASATPKQTGSTSTGDEGAQPYNLDAGAARSPGMQDKMVSQDQTYPPAQFPGGGADQTQSSASTNSEQPAQNSDTSFLDAILGGGAATGAAKMMGSGSGTTSPGTAVDLPGLQATNMRVHPGTDVAPVAEHSDDAMREVINFVRRLAGHGR